MEFAGDRHLYDKKNHDKGGLTIERDEEGHRG